MKKIFNKKTFAVLAGFFLLTSIIVSNPLRTQAQEGEPVPTETIENEATSLPSEGQLHVSCFGKAAHFDGDDDGLEVNIPNSISFSSPRTSIYFTYEAWIRPEGATDDFRHAVIGREYIIDQTVLEFSIIDQKLTAKVSTLAGFKDFANAFVTGRTIIKTDGQWHHVALVRSNKTVQIFLDGKEDSDNVPIVQDGVSFNIGGTFTIGAMRFSSGRFLHDNFRGYIDEVRVSDTARYLGKFNPPIKPFIPDDHTMALWHMDEKPDSQIAHDSANILPIQFGRNNAIVFGSERLFEDSTIPCSTPPPPSVATPQITTVRIRNATKGHPIFENFIRATDADLADKLTLTADGLPAGVMLVCPEKHLAGRIDCILEGIPIKLGQTQFKVTVKDNTGKESNKILRIMVTTL